MPLNEVVTLLTSAKAAYEIAKGINSLHVEVERNEGISKILEMLISVQMDAATLVAKYQDVLAQKDQLAKQVSEFERWSQTENEYELSTVGPGIFVYKYKKPEDATMPPHWLCSNCWEGRTKSILQRDHDHSSHASYTCPKCKTEFKWAKSDAPKQDFTVVHRSKWDGY